MKTNIITKWAALLLTVSGFSALTVSGQFVLDDPGNHINISGVPDYIFNNATYSSSNSVPAVTVNTSTVTINTGWFRTSGTGVDGLTATNSLVTGSAVYIRTTGSAASGAYFVNSAGSLAAVDIHTVGGNAHGVCATSSTLTLSGSISTGEPLFPPDPDLPPVLPANPDNNCSIGVNLNNSAGTLANVSITTAGAEAHGLSADNSAVTASGLTISTTGNTAYGAYFVNSAGTLAAADIRTTGSASHGVNANNSTLTLSGATVTAGGEGSFAAAANDNARITAAGSALNGGLFNNSGSGFFNLADSAVTGSIVSDGGVLLVDIQRGVITGDVVELNNGEVTLTLSDHSRGRGNWQGGSLNLDSASSWNFVSGTSIIDNLSNDGELIFDVNTDDGSHATLNVTGTASGTGKINVGVTGSTAISDDEKKHILGELVQGTGSNQWQFDPIDWGLEEDDVIVSPDGSIYVQPNGKLSAAGNIAVGLLSAQKGSWFAQQNSLLKRMGELRLSTESTSSTLSGKDDKAVTLSADNLIENVWIRAYGQQLNFNASVTGQAFKQYVYGTDIGTDHKFTLNNSNVLYTGIFAGYGAADTDHRHHGSKSDIHNYYAGLYGSWLNNSGWYADATLKAQYTNNTLNGSNGITSFNGSYHNWSVGGSIELGKQFKFKNDWFIEPQFQANYVHILASDYTLSQGLNVNVSDLDAFQLRLGVVAGRTLKLKNGGALQPYVKVSGVEMLSTGGKLTAMGNTVRPNLDGARAELGAGIIWQLDAHNQLHLDYEASFGDKYDKPWGLTAGYRYQF